MEGRGRGAQAVRQASTGSTQAPAARDLPPPQPHNPVPTPPRRTPIVPPSPKQSLPPTSPRCPRTRPPFLHLTPTTPCQPPHHHHHHRPTTTHPLGIVATINRLRSPNFITDELSFTHAPRVLKNNNNNKTQGPDLFRLLPPIQRDSATFKSEMTIE